MTDPVNELKELIIEVQLSEYRQRPIDTKWLSRKLREILAAVLSTEDDLK